MGLKKVLRVHEEEFVTIQLVFVINFEKIDCRQKKPIVFCITESRMVGAKNQFAH